MAPKRLKSLHVEVAKDSDQILWEDFPHRIAQSSTLLWITWRRISLTAMPKPIQTHVINNSALKTTYVLNFLLSYRDAKTRQRAIAHVKYSVGSNLHF